MRDASGNIVAIYDQNLNQKEIPLYGSGRLGVHFTAQDKNVFEFKDHLGSVRARAYWQGASLTTDQWRDYYPYGLEMDGNKEGKDTRFGYQGDFSEEDGETNFNFFEARVFDPVIGRWMAVDPARQYASGYVGMGNNPVNGVDPDGRRAEGGGEGIWDSIMALFHFNSYQDKNELFKGVESGNLDLQEEWANIQSSLIEVYESYVTPYLSVSVGKQTSENYPISGFTSLTITKDGIYQTMGLDMTASAPGASLISVSGSAGYIFGPKDGIPGYGLGLSGGGFVGIEGSRSVSIFPMEWGKTGSIGVVLSTSPAYVSGNVGYTWKLYEF